MCRTRRPKIDGRTKERIVSLALQYPDRGPQRLARLLERERIITPPFAINCILRVEDLRSRNQRIALLENRSEEEPGYLPVELETPNSGKETGDTLEDRITAFALNHPYHGPKRLARLLKRKGKAVDPATINALLRAKDLRSSEKRINRIEKHTHENTTTPPDEPLPAEEIESARHAPRKVEPVVVWLRPRRSVGSHIFSPLLWGRIALQLSLVLVVIYSGYHLAKIQWRKFDDVGEGASNSQFLANNRQSHKTGSFPSRHRTVIHPEHPIIAKARIENNKDSDPMPSTRALAGNLGLKLIGTLVADPSEKSVAIIEYVSTRIQETFKEGDRIGDGRLKKIIRDRIIIDAGGAETMIALKRTLPAAEWQPGPQGAAAVAQASAEPPEDIAPSENNTPRPKGRTRFHHLDRQKVDSALADVDRVLQQIEIQPSTSHGHAAGIRIAPIEADSIFAELGLRSTDVIVGVNGQSITTPDQAAFLIQSIKSGGSVTIQVKGKRRNRIIQLDIS